MGYRKTGKRRALILPDYESSEREIVKSLAYHRAHLNVYVRVHLHKYGRAVAYVIRAARARVKDGKRQAGSVSTGVRRLKQHLYAFNPGLHRTYAIFLRLRIVRLTVYIRVR